MDSWLKIGTISFKRCWRSLVLVSIVGVLMIFIAGFFTTTRRRRDISKTTGGDYDVSPNPLALAQSRKDVRLQEQENLFQARQNGLRDFCKNITNRRRPMEENKDNNMAHNKPEGILATSRNSDLSDAGIKLLFGGCRLKREKISFLNTPRKALASGQNLDRKSNILKIFAW